MMMSQPEQGSKRKRVLACVLCQQRKVKCDRKFPCANCVKASAQCVLSTLVPRQKRRKFSERVLSDRLRHYEELLRQNDIEFKPLLTLAGGEASFSERRQGFDSSGEGYSDQQPKETTSKPETLYEAK